MLPEKERIALYYLNSFPGMYPARLNAMVRYTSSFAEALKVSSKEYIEQGIFKRIGDAASYDAFRQDGSGLKAAADEYHALEKKRIRMIDSSEEDMPNRLRMIQDPPCVLFLKGRLPSDTIPAVSIIGSRCASSYGISVAEYFGRELALAGLQVVSGMAAGIDCASQAGALNGSDDVFAVLGSGVDVCYPSTSKAVYREILSRGGVLSEFNPGQRAVGYHFVIRNRIIAGLCDALLVIEAAKKSGTAITVEDALNQGKDVFALPGRITDPLGLGCNQLIRDGAMILTSPKDVLEYFGIDSCCETGSMKPWSGQPLTKEEKKIQSVLGPDPMHIELICEASGIPLQLLSSLLNSMELKGAVRSAGHASYVKVYR